MQTEDLVDAVIESNIMPNQDNTYCDNNHVRIFYNSIHFISFVLFLCYTNIFFCFCFLYLLFYFVIRQSKSVYQDHGGFSFNEPTIGYHSKHFE